MTPILRSTIIALAVGIGMLGAFTVGVGVGVRQARHFDRWVDTYPQKFRGPETKMFFRAGVPDMLPGAHGVFGRVVSVAEPSFIVEGRDGFEQEVVAMPGTFIRIGRGEGSFVDIVPDRETAVFGAPNGEGQIEAKLIRVFDGFPR